MELNLIAFTDRGYALAQKLAGALGGKAVRGGKAVGLNEWTEAHFSGDALVFVGAVGIAVRAIAPYVKRKTVDPAVVVVDENARYAIPILSGHLGGANRLARAIASLTGAQAVITTATDGRNLFAADVWAKNLGLRVMNARAIKTVSAALLAGKTVLYWSRWPIPGTPPKGLAAAESREQAALVVDAVPPQSKAALWLCPPLFLGIGCRKNIGCEALEAAFAQSGLPAECVVGAASIDVKQNEAGLLAFCQGRGWPIGFYSAGQLVAVPGQFTASAFVQKTVGVDNVCERAALLAAGEGAMPALPRQAGGGVTLAAACRIDWNWGANE